MSGRGAWLFAFLVLGAGVSQCGGDSEGTGGDGDSGKGGGAGDSGTGGKGTGGKGTGGAAGTSTGGAAGKGGTSGKGGTPSTGGTDSGGAGDGGTSAGGAGDGGSPDTGGQGGAPACEPDVANGSAVPLAQATATFSQTAVFDFSVGHAIDGVTNDQRGWAIMPLTGTIGAQTAAFETATSTPKFDGGTRLTFVLKHEFDFSGDHALGRFRISVTTADRAQFADGVAGTTTPGIIGADSLWTQLTPSSACGLSGVGLTTLNDHSLLVDVNHLIPMQYVVVAETSLTGITGVRLEALQDASLPLNGPGLQTSNGNFVLTEFEMYAEAP